MEGGRRGASGSGLCLRSGATWRAEGLLFRADLAGQVAGIWRATPSLHRPPPGGMKPAWQVDRHLYSGRGQCAFGCGLSVCALCMFVSEYPCFSLFAKVFALACGHACVCDHPEGVE